MMGISDETKKLTLIALVLMIFTSVFGFNNIPRSFYLMGYGAIPWFLLSGLTFFIPFAFMLAEFGSAFQKEKGGIYSWMSASIGPKYAFVGTFMWYASYIVWMVNVSNGLWIVFSNAIFGTDTTPTWSLFGLNSTQTIGILAVCWIIFVTFTATKGLDKIKKITSVGGVAVALLNIVLLVGAIAVLIGSGGHLAQPILSTTSFVASPNPSYGSPIAILSFLVFALFAYGGIEVVGGLVDETKNPEKTFPKGLILSAVIIAVGYSIGIFLVGIFTNWSQVLSSKSVHMGNVGYVVMNNLGYQIAHTFGGSQAFSLSMGAWMARFVGISMVLALTGAFFALAYSPLKQIIQGTPKELWPGKLALIEDGMPRNAMWVQCIAVTVMILLVSFGGAAAAIFFNKLVLMTNVAMTLPYMFISGAFYAFKKNEDIKKPFQIFKSNRSALIWTVVVTSTVGFANFFTIIQPAMEGDLSSTIWSIAGPLFFAIVALLMYWNYERKMNTSQ
ncbi:MAG TPA: glutamate/gamma-aminobutyrate family transporter YjeM [Desulfosporosinus sp.]|nr:glutamate/gamma-aminobutyrate family transporter YjeM [Desulfosporosinus sp.]